MDETDAFRRPRSVRRWHSGFGRASGPATSEGGDAMQTKSVWGLFLLCVLIVGVWAPGAVLAVPTLLEAQPGELDLEGRPGETVMGQVTISGGVPAAYEVKADIGTAELDGDTVLFSFTIPQQPDRGSYAGTITVVDAENQETIEVPVTVRVIAEPVVLQGPSVLTGKPGEEVSATVVVVQGDAPFALSVDRGVLSKQSGVSLQEPVEYRFTIPQDAKPGQTFGVTVTATSALDAVGEASFTVEVVGNARPVVLDVPAGIEARAGETVQAQIRVIEGDPPFTLSVSAGQLDRTTEVGLNDPVRFTYTVPADAQAGDRISVRVSAVSALGGTGEAVFRIAVSASLADVLESLGRTPPQREMGRVIGTVCSGGTAGPNFQRDCNALVSAALGGDPNASQALAQVTPDQVSAPTDASQTAMQTQMRNLGRRLAALRAGARGFSVSGLSFSLDGQPIRLAALSSALLDGVFNASEAETARSPLGTVAGGRLGVFINGDVRFGNRDRTDRVEGFDFDTYGITAGVDYRFTDSLVAGLSLGYTNSSLDIDGSRGSLDSDGWTGSVYGTWYKDLDAKRSLYVDGLISYGALGYDQLRSVRYGFQTGSRVDQGLNADFDGSQWAFSIGGGYRMQRGALSFGPVARLEYVSASIDGYDEKARDPSAPGSGWRVHIDGQDVDSLTTRVGLDLSYAMSQSWGVFVPQLTADWVHEFKLDADPVVGYFVEDSSRTLFRLAVDGPDRDYFNLGVGAVAQLPYGMSGYVFYRKLLGYDTLSVDSISFGLRMEF